MSKKLGIDDAYRLFHRGSLALADVEANGFAIDVEYLTKHRKKLRRDIDELEHKLKSDKVWVKWRKRFGGKAKLGNRKQLATIVFDELGYKRSKGFQSTLDGESESNDEAAFRDVDHPFVRDYISLTKMQKMHGTYLSGIAKCTDVDGLLHTVFNLHVARTFRSSSSDINLQNLPIRNPEIGNIIRSCFIPRDREKRVIVEIDYSGIEVRVAACYNHDPMMLKYIKDPTTDMHRDMASEIYGISTKQIEKAVRYCAKNMFVFPEFYGSFFLQCAPALWDACTRMNLMVGDVPMRKHLKKRMGITELGNIWDMDKWKDKSWVEDQKHTFAYHVKQVESDFWKRRFKVYDEWKHEWYGDYLKKGYFQSHTGFMYHGSFKRNDVLNYPIQGSAFHCLLWSLTRINDLIKKHRMDTKLICQIHDSIVADVPVSELADYLALAVRVMTKDIRKAWPWIIVKLDVEAEVTPLGGTWADKKAVDLSDLSKLSV